MKEFLRTKGFKMTPQRELIFRAFFESGRHVSVDELYERVRKIDRSIGYSTVWRNLKLICKVGLAEEVNMGDGITRYDRVTHIPHGHLFCMGCKKVIEFNVENIVGVLGQTAKDNEFTPESFRVEIQGYCPQCREAGLRPISVPEEFAELAEAKSQLSNTSNTMTASRENK